MQISPQQGKGIPRGSTVRITIESSEHERIPWKLLEATLEAFQAHEAATIHARLEPIFIFNSSFPLDVLQDHSGIVHTRYQEGT